MLRPAEEHFFFFHSESSYITTECYMVTPTACTAGGNDCLTDDNFDFATNDVLSGHANFQAYYVAALAGYEFRQTSMIMTPLAENNFYLVVIYTVTGGARHVSPRMIIRAGAQCAEGDFSIGTKIPARYWDDAITFANPSQSQIFKH
jgi:hypothetical protein